MWCLLDKEIDKNIKIEGFNSRLIKISKTTFLVGKNNSGKSYLLRNLLKRIIKIYTTKQELINDLNESLKGISIDNFKNFKNITQENIKLLYEEYTSKIELMWKISNTKVDSNSFYMDGQHTKSYRFDTNLIVQAKNTLFNDLELNGDEHELCRKLVNHENELQKMLFDKFIIEIKPYLADLPDKDLLEMGYLLKDVERKYNIEKFYFPIYRMIRHPLKDPRHEIDEEDNRDIFSDRIKSEYNLLDEINIVTGLNFYQSYKKNLLGSKEKREKTAKFEKFISEYFFNNKNISIIPDEETSEIKININNADDRFIYEVGDGITSLIILMYTIFMECDKDKNKIFFIEEPENNFHPGYQKLFVNMITTYKDFKNCIFIITTHSNHLLDTGKVENKAMIYLCKKTDTEFIVEERQKEYYDVLDELGVNASSVLLANKAIWIEGKYDALYIRKLLNLKNIKDDADKVKYIEDYDYCFIPYGGKNMVLIDFAQEDENEFKENAREFICAAKKINSKYAVVLDDDSMYEENKKKKIQNFERLIKQLGGGRVYKHQVREIENYFSEEIVKEFIRQNVEKEYKTDEYIEKLNIKYSDYMKINLGHYINNQIKKVTKGKNALKVVTNRKEGFVTKGALYNKQKFYDVVCEFFERDNFTYEKSIGNEAKDLIEFIEKFIKE